MGAGNDMTSDVEGELTAHSDSYSLFTQMMKWGTIISAIVAFIVVFVLIA